MGHCAKTGEEVSGEFQEALLRSSMLQMAALRSTKRGLWREGPPRRREWTMRRLSLQLPGKPPLEK
jgi:hypothetical protein